MSRRKNKKISATKGESYTPKSHGGSSRKLKSAASPGLPGRRDGSVSVAVAKLLLSSDSGSTSNGAGSRGSESSVKNFGGRVDRSSGKPLVKSNRAQGRVRDGKGRPGGAPSLSEKVVYTPPILAMGEEWDFDQSSSEGVSYLYDGRLKVVGSGEHLWPEGRGVYDPHNMARGLIPKVSLNQPYWIEDSIPFSEISG